MEQSAFETLRNIENTWWHFGRQQAVKQALKVAAVKSGKVFDAGLGYGGMHDFLKSYGEVEGTEPNQDAAKMALVRGYRAVFNNEQEVISLGNTYNLIGAFDVIEHVDDDQTFVKNLYTLTQAGGHLVATVPAFSWLWSQHDVTHQHFRRHTIKSMTKLLEGAGYVVVYARYWNVFLFPLAVVSRLLGKSGEAGLHPHPVVTSVLKRLMWLEPKVIRFIPVPFGLSVVIVGVKRSS